MDKKVSEIFEKVKLTAQAVVSGAGKVANTAGKKAGDVVNNTKRSFKIFDLNNEIELLYREIGRLVYATHTGCEIQNDEIDTILAQIDEKNELINQMKEQNAELKQTVECPVCGQTCSKQDTFCRFCGEKLSN